MCISETQTHTQARVASCFLATEERGEILVTFASYATGTLLQLRSYGNELPNGTFGADEAWINHAGASMPNYSPNFMNGNSFTVLSFNVVTATAGAVTTAPPSSLGSDTPISESQASVTREKWLFSGGGQGTGVKIGSHINYSSSTAFDMNIVDDAIPLGTTEIWKLHGAADQYHPFHIHDVQFYILSRTDSLNNSIELTSNEIGRKDVVWVGPKETVRFITKFNNFWGDVPYMYHCHIAVHEDLGMMKQFVVNISRYIDKNYTGQSAGDSTRPYKTLTAAVNFPNDGTTIYFKSDGVHE